ncbi:MAG: ribosome maturation factor RimP [Desulfobacterales bacterium]|jgi:ribosome maturation factor RimP
MEGRRKKINKRLKSRVKTRRQKKPVPENKEKIVSQARDLIGSLCENEGLELVHLEYQREAGGRILRLFIDRPGGVTLDDCVRISRQSSDLLDVYLENIGPYRLEVSSPGPNRPLGKRLDFDRFKGSRVKIKTAQSVDGQKKFKGVLMGISEEIVKLSVDGKIACIPYQEIITAQLTD